MKSAVADYRYRVLCLRIVPVTGSPIYLTDHPRDLVMGGHTYLSTAGYQFTGYAATAGFSPASVDLEGIAGASGITRAAIAAGLFDGAVVSIFATSWSAPIEDEEPIVRGIFGKARLEDDRYTIDGLSLIDALSQSVGLVYQAACPKVFLSQGFAGCLVPVAPNTVTGTLTQVTSARVFRDSTRSEAADTFGTSLVRFTSGALAGGKGQEIASHLADGTLETFEAFPQAPAVGDAYELQRGCRKRPQDCESRLGNSGLFNNIVNFGGDCWVPTSATYAQRGKR
jgi:uncharacterized phage protein (TIGR02218 family)